MFLRWLRQWPHSNLCTLLLPLSTGLPWGCDVSAGKEWGVLMPEVSWKSLHYGCCPKSPSSFCLWEARVGGRPHRCV